VAVLARITECSNSSVEHCGLQFLGRNHPLSWSPLVPVSSLLLYCSHVDLQLISARLEALVPDLNLSVRIGADPPKSLLNICANSAHAGHFMKSNTLKVVHSLLGTSRKALLYSINESSETPQPDSLPNSFMLLLLFPLSGLTFSNSHILLSFTQL
jgi:hypothetical protein